MAFAMLRRGRPISIPPPEKAVRFLESEGQALATPTSGRRAVVGSPQTVAAGLREVAEEYGADELIIVAITHDHGARRRSYELIAEAFDLAGAPAAQRIAS
jgi:alkanesulfonate monooxygenase SsuD/methylene tetrahydromethanopterin reductase-like flavin-dependent oxidoreductase (luciferase family)